VRDDTVARNDDGGTINLVQASVNCTAGALVHWLTLTAAIDG